MTRSNSTNAALPTDLSFLNPLCVDDLARFGRINDGGYILPKRAVADIDSLISFGISEDWSLEADIARLKPGIPIHAYDHTVSSTKLLRSILGAYKTFMVSKSPMEARRRLLAERWRITLDYFRFFRKNRVHFRERVCAVEEQAHDAGIDKIFSRLPRAQRAFVKVDIEGAEYDVIPRLLHYGSRIRLLAFEFHDTESRRGEFLSCCRQLLQDFRIVHLHGNNYNGRAPDGFPEVVEATFAHRTVVPDNAVRRNHLPLAVLDSPNNPFLPDLELDFC